jgi:outer membrane protein insertion porin family
MILVRSLPAYCPIIVCLIAAQATLLHAQYQKYEGQRVTKILFDPPRQPLETSELLQILPLKPGQPLQMSEVRASIDRLFATGRYADIQVDAQPDQDGVSVSFVTKNSWFIGSVRVKGNISSPPTAGQLENSANLDLGQPYADTRLQEAVENQKRLLESNGLYRNELHPVFQWDATYQQANITFDVDSGARARFATPVAIGDLKMDTARLLDGLKFRRWLIHSWKPMTQTRLRQGLDSVRALYQKDRRLEAKVSLESIKYDAASDTATPTLRINAGPRIEIHAIGAKLSDRTLQRYVPVFEEHTVDNDLLVEGAHNLQDYFQSQGYFEADVEFKQQRAINDKASIDYLINTGPRHKVVLIQVAGNHYFKTEAIRERMFLRTASFLQFPHGRFSESLIRQDENSILNLYQANGFRDVKVTYGTRDDYGGKKGDIAIFITIDEGPQYFINSLKVDGIERLDRAKILTALSSSDGQPFSEFNVAVDRDSILARYFESGFPDVTFEWSSKPAAQPNRIDLLYVIHEGSQQFVRQVIYSGNKDTKDSLIERTLRLNPGDPLSPTAMTEAQRKLYDLGVFARVQTAIQDPDGETASKYVLYDLDEARHYSIGVGFGAEFARIGGCGTCLDAPAGQTGFSPRVSLNITRSNLWGDAHSISLSTRVSTLEQRALLTYTWPRFQGNDKLSLSITGLYDNSRDVRTFSYKREEGALQLSQRLSKATTLSYRYAYRLVTIDQSTLKITPLLIPLLSQPVRVGLVSINLIQDHRDDPVDPHKGYFNTIDLGLAEHVFGSQRNFVKFLGRNASYYSLGKKVVLARTTEFGDIYAFHAGGDVLDAVPLPERFFGGGGSSNRAFPEEQSGPRDPETGFPIGGTALLFNQTELRFPLFGENIGGVIFHDMGNTFSSLDAISFRVKQRNLQDFDYMVHAIGFGIRYRTPVGPLRVDLAYSINPPRFYGFKGTEQDLINAGVNPCSTGNCTQTGVSHFQYFFSIGQTF